VHSITEYHYTFSYSYRDPKGLLGLIWQRNKPSFLPRKIYDLHPLTWKLYQFFRALMELKCLVYVCIVPVYDLSLHEYIHMCMVTPSYL